MIIFSLWITQQVIQQKKIKNLVKKYKIKVLFTVPYQSYFNPIELSFR
jgi:transposase